MADETTTAEEKPSWVNFSVPNGALSGEHKRIDMTNTYIDKETGEEMARTTTWRIVTLPDGFKVGDDDLSGYSFAVGKAFDDKYNEGWSRIGFRKGTSVNLRLYEKGADAREASPEPIAMKEVSAEDLAEAARRGFGRKPSDSVYLTVAKKLVSEPKPNKEGIDVYNVYIPKGVTVGGIDLSGYHLNVDSVMPDGSGRVYEHAKSYGFRFEQTEQLSPFIVSNDGKVSRLPKPVAAVALCDAVKENSDRYFEKLRNDAAKTRGAEKKDEPEKKQVKTKTVSAPAADRSRKQSK